MSLPSKGKPTGLFVAAAVIIASSIWFAACATGSKSSNLWNPDEDGNDDDTNDDPDASAGDSGNEPGGFGEPCTIPANCASKQCSPIGPGADAEKVCTESCTPGKACPSGGHCVFIPGRDYQCVPDKDSICDACTSDSNCKGVGDKCLESAAGDRYCARDCSWDGICPKNFKCVDSDGDGSGIDAGADGDADAAGEMEDSEAGPPPDDGAGDGGSGAPPGGKKGNKYCVPVDDKGAEQSCDCGPKRKGITRNCSNTSAHGTCWGKQSCDGKAWGKCDARKPEAEVCDGIDNDCNGEIDEGPDDQLCPAVPNAKLFCESGQCKLNWDSCDDGFTHFPPGPVSDGCQCPVMHGPESNTCANAIHVGSVNDTAATPEIYVTGTLSDPSRSDVFSFDAFDTNANTQFSGTDNFHVSIRFEQPSPDLNDEFRFEVVRGNDCAASTPAVGLTAYDWCVDFKGERDGGVVGQAPCGRQDGLNWCGGGGGRAGVNNSPNSSRYYVRVYRNPDLPVNAFTCREYRLVVRGNGQQTDYPCGEANTCQAP